MLHLKAIEIIARSLRKSVAGDMDGREEMAIGQYNCRHGLLQRGSGHCPLHGSSPQRPV